MPVLIFFSKLLSHYIHNISLPCGELCLTWIHLGVGGGVDRTDLIKLLSVYAVILVVLLVLDDTSHLTIIVLSGLDNMMGYGPVR